ncbi:MAG: WD40 repeat domain-containing protein [Gemmataceae bacterium]
MSLTLPPLCPSEPPRVLGAPALHTQSELLALGQSVDGTLWSVEEPGLLRQWQLASRRQLAQHSLDELATVWAFNWAGRLVASGSDEVAIWEVYSGDQLARWPTPEGQWVTALAFQPGVAVLAVGHDDGRVQVWQWTEQRLLYEWEGIQGGVSALAFSLDRKHLAVAGEDRQIRLYDLASGQQVRTFEGHTDRIPALVWHPDGHRLFSAGWDTTVRVWDVAKEDPLILLNNHCGQVQAIALSADGQLIAAADAANTVHIWDTAGYREVAVLQTMAGEVTCLCFTPDDDRGNRRPAVLAYGGVDRVIHLWDARQGNEVGRDTEALLYRTQVALDPSGSRLYSLAGGVSLRVFDRESGETLQTFEPANLHTFALSSSNLLALSLPEETTAERRSLRLVDSHGQELAICEGQKGPITALAFRPDGQMLASGGIESSDVWLWKVPSGMVEVILPDAVSFCSVETLAWRPDGAELAVAGIDHLATSERDGEVGLWDLTTRTCRYRLPGGATALAYSPDSRLLAVAHLKHTITLYDVQTLQPQATLWGHVDTINAVVFSPDGQRLVSASADRTLRVWDISSGKQLGAWELDNRLQALAIDADGQYVYTGNLNTSCYQIELESVTAPVV